jgi:hypothetical protein
MSRQPGYRDMKCSASTRISISITITVRHSFRSDNTEEVGLETDAEIHVNCNIKNPLV